MSEFPPKPLSPGRIARDTLRRLLNPLTETEERHVEWLCGWHTETVEVFVKMIKRAVVLHDPTVVPMFSVDRRNEE